MHFWRDFCFFAWQVLEIMVDLLLLCGEEEEEGGWCGGKLE
jgi:hypothetical protein